jgi:IMP dehydrogenase
MIINKDGAVIGKIKETVCFDDVLLKPQYSDIKSRSEVDIGNDLGGQHYYLPIISSPMDTVTEKDMCIAMAGRGGLGVVHRYNTIDEQQRVIESLYNQINNIAVAIGVSDDFKERASACVASGASTLCIDVAHGHHALVEGAIKTLKDKYGENVHVMAGNVATLEAFNDLADWGADSIRVGVGGGSICSTRIQTGHGIPTLQSVMDCAETDRNALLIADGGFKVSGDVVKALAAGADFVMLGSMLAATDESPGETYISADGKRYKVYRGMASKEAQMDWRGKTASLEGVSTTVPYKGSVELVLAELEQGIRSGFSYTGARTLAELQAKAEFIKQTSAGQAESSTHILRRK